MPVTPRDFVTGKSGSAPLAAIEAVKRLVPDQSIHAVAIVSEGPSLQSLLSDGAP
jgi:hypothetical protein